MKWGILLLISSYLFAGNLQDAYLSVKKQCGQFVNANENYLVVGYNDHKKGHGTYTVTDLSADFQVSEFETFTDEYVVDSLFTEKSLYILTHTRLVERDLETLQEVGSYAITQMDMVLSGKQKATGMTRVGDELFISLGTLGFSRFSLTEKIVLDQVRLAEFQLPKVSMATDVVSNGEYVFFLMDNVTLVPPNQKPAFRGIAVYSIAEKKVLKHVVFHDAGQSGLDLVNGQLVVSFSGFGNLVFYNIDRVLQAKHNAWRPLRANKRAWRYPISPVVTHRGKLMFNQGEIYSCTNYLIEKTGNFTDLNRHIFKLTEIK